MRCERISGYATTLRERGLGLPLVWPSGDDKVTSLEAMCKLQEAHPDVTAVVCNGDMVALGACLALLRAGKAPGREVSVVGFDDIQEAAVATPPRHRGP